MKIISGNHVRRTGWLLLCCATGPAVSAAEVTTNQFRQPGTFKVDFDRDIQPILAQSCLRCHGPEKPRSHFRLDNRVSALEGGNDNTNDIVPGDSHSSLLLNYVARQVPDMEMPPAGRGAPLTPQQIGLLTAWITQGAQWSVTNQGPQTTVIVEPNVGGFAVHGNGSKFRELEGIPAGPAGGVQNFSLSEQINPNEKLAVEGRVLLPQQDYKVSLALDETDFGFIHAGFEQWRKYYNDEGAYNAASVPPEFQQNQDLYVDNGRFWADFGQTLPNRPQFVLGYEYQYQQGTQSTLDSGFAGGFDLYPSTQAISEGTHIIKLDVSQDFDDWHLADSARVELYRDQKSGLESSIATSTSDDYHHVQGMNTLTLDKQIRDWWYLSGAVYYSRLDGSDFFSQSQSFLTSPLSSQAITLKRESEIFSVASLFTPLDCLNFSVGSQNEWTREEGFGDSVPDLDFLVNTPVDSHLDTFKTSQNAGIHYTQLPYTVLFSEGRFDEENVSEFQEGDDNNPTMGFVRQTDAFNRHGEVRTGFNTSPWRWFSLNAQYHNQLSDTDYNQLADVFQGLDAPTNGYPAFILNRHIEANGLETKLVLRPANWLSTTLTCNLTDTIYKSKTDPAFDAGLMEIVSAGGVILDGHSRDQIYGLSTTLTPFRQLYFTSAFTFDDTRLSTAANDDPSVSPYRGQICTLSATATYALNLKTSLQASYIFTRADYAQNADAPALPYGLDFTRHEVAIGLTRQISKSVSGALHYTFSQYVEPGVAGAGNFSAQGVFASISYKWQ